MPEPRIAFLTPPLIKPCEPGLSAAAAASRLRLLGVDAFAVDANAEWHAWALCPQRLAAVLDGAGTPEDALPAFRRALRAMQSPVPALRRAGTYRDRRRYASAAADLQDALRLASSPFPSFRLGVGDVEWAGRRPQRTADLEEAARSPGPFDGYFLGQLIPRLRRERITHAAVSLTFLNQAFAAFRLAALLREGLPSARLLLGGPLPACWKAAGARMGGAAFGLFDEIRAGAGDGDAEALSAGLGGRAAAAGDGEVPFAPDLPSVPWNLYLSPVPIVPAALGRGCYWRRCAFCPDHLHPERRASRPDAVEGWLAAVADRFPGGAMVHLTDSALPPSVLERVAETVKAGRLPIRWHGFVRVEEAFTDPGFARHLAEGGCAMLQWGIETASGRLLAMAEKGVPPERARRALRACSAAGIKNHAFLLFGLPTETEADREETLEFVRREAGCIGDLNVSLLNLPRRSPMHDDPGSFGITELVPFHRDADLALYDDFRCGESHPRLEARRWLSRRFLRDDAVKSVLGGLNAPFKANHSCFLPCGSGAHPDSPGRPACKRS